MSTQVTTGSDVFSSPFSSAHPKDTSYAPDALALWHFSPPKPTTTRPSHYDFTVEEVSDDNWDHSHDTQVLHPYELEEVESAAEEADNPAADFDVDEDDGDEPQNLPPADFSPRLRRMRWQSARRPSVLAPSSPTRPNPRKRLRSEAPDTDTDSDNVDSPYARSEPPTLRRRIHGPAHNSGLVTPSAVSDASPPQAPLTSAIDDPMDIDTQSA